jgi:hypothetical protein
MRKGFQTGSQFAEQASHKKGDLEYEDKSSQNVRNKRSEIRRI